MATAIKGPYYWDVRGASSAREKFAQDNKDEMPQGSTYLETDSDHDIYIWNADTKAWELF